MEGVTIVICVNLTAILLSSFVTCFVPVISLLAYILSRHFLIASQLSDLILLLFLPPHHLLCASCVILIAAIDMLLVAHWILWILRGFAVPSCNLSDGLIL